MRATPTVKQVWEEFIRERGIDLTQPIVRVTARELREFARGEKDARVMANCGVARHLSS